MEFSLTLSESQSQEQPTDFTSVFAAYRGRICRYLYSLVGEAAQAEDLAQDCFLKAYRALQRGQRPDNLSAWLYTIATNAAISHLRRRKLIAWLPLLPGGEVETARTGRDPAVVASERDLLRRTLAKLSPADASCLLLRFQADLTYAELASVLGTSEGAAKTRVCRARAAFCETYTRLSREVSR
ncbi:MAG: sigma-70 family RNA polymerase sigma factor [Chloroflexi bacterium]|nr:sigma-70 family RNA polymerase sigma factor [Chloroflexota bacterium]